MVFTWQEYDRLLEASGLARKTNIDRWRRAAERNRMVLKRSGYYSTRTLLGGEPDVNRRAIWKWGEDRPVCVFNQEMEPWTGDDELRLRLILRVLNEDFGCELEEAKRKA